MRKKRTCRRRINPKVALALTYMIEDGLSRQNAAAKAQICDNSLYKALRRPDVLARRKELMEVLRGSEASRTIARVAALADGAQSEHVRMSANEWLGGLDGVSPVARSEVHHRHEGGIPGLTLILSATPRIDDALIIEGKAREHPSTTEARRRLIASLPIPVEHPAMAQRGNKRGNSDGE